MSLASLAESHKDTTGANTHTHTPAETHTQAQILANSFSITPTWVTFITRREQVVGGRWRERAEREEVSTLLDGLALSSPGRRLHIQALNAHTHTHTQVYMRIPHLHADRTNKTEKSQMHTYMCMHTCWQTQTLWKLTADRVWRRCVIFCLPACKGPLHR